MDSLPPEVGGLVEVPIVPRRGDARRSTGWPSPPRSMDARSSRSTSRRCVGGDWRGGEALMSRSYGKPRATRRACCSRARHDAHTRLPGASHRSPQLRQSLGGASSSGSAAASKESRYSTGTAPSRSNRPNRTNRLAHNSRLSP
jgi:hypothetical protein